MGCHYIYNNVVYSSYEQLLKQIKDSDLSTQLAILFSLDKDKMNSIADELIDKSIQINMKKSNNIIDGDADFDIKKGYTTQTFIDSAYFKINNKPPIFQLNKDEYVNIIKNQMLDKGMKEEDIDQFTDRLIQKWNTIAEDASNLHRIIVSSTYDTLQKDFISSLLNTAFEGMESKFPNIVLNVEKIIYLRNKNARVVRNINISALLKNIAETILGHIDYLCVREDGDLEIFNLKTSILNMSEWNLTKLEKYKYLLALIKRILEYNGFNTRNIRLNIIPLKLTYNNDFEVVNSVDVGKAVSLDFTSLAYTFEKYNNIAAQFIDSHVTLDDLEDDDMKAANMALNKIFRNRDINIQYNGIKESAKSWAKANWSTIATRSTKEPGWIITLPGEEPIYVKDTREGENNEEVINLITDREEGLLNNSAKEKGISRIIKDIKNSYNQLLSFVSIPTKGATNNLLNELLNKYFDGKLDEHNKVIEYKWELVGNLTLLNDSGILVFRHKTTNQIDVINITPYDVTIKNKIKGRDNLLGAFIPDLNKEKFDFQSNFGNIEAIRTMILLNLILSKFPFTPKLGVLKVISASPYHNKKGSDFDFNSLLPVFNTVLKVANRNDTTFTIPNNFLKQQVSAIDTITSFIQTWKEVLADYPNINQTELKGLRELIHNRTTLEGLVIEGLENLNTTEAKVAKLEMIIERLEKIGANLNLPLNPKNLLRALKSPNPSTQALAKVYTAALHALNVYNNDLSDTNESFSQMLEYLIKQQSINNSSVRTTGYMFLKTINKIANRMTDEYTEIRKIIMQYYKDCGYTNLLNQIIGNQASLYLNLYALDADGYRTMKFKNPYDMSEDLKSYERKFLKDILWEFNKIRYRMHDDWKWTYKNKEDPKLLADVSANIKGYLNVPLERASAATRRINIKNGYKDFKDRWMRRLKHPKDAFKELSEGILDDEENSQVQNDLENLLAYNPFTKSENDTRRVSLLNKYGVNYFETNVENLIIDFLEKDIQYAEYNKMLTRIRGVLLSLYIKGENEGDTKNLEHTIKAINDFLSTSVFNHSIMEPLSQHISGILDPLRKAVSTCYIAGNVAGGFRDVIQGVLENTVKAVIKFQTDIDAQDVAFGYKSVVTDGVHSVMTINKLNQLNIKYRFSNLDVARISEGQKTGRTGMLNAENWAYSTLRGPDYLNRMVLFVAKMHHDGCYDAYSVINGKLVYNWKLDKRFSAYANNKTDDPDYAKLRSLYLSLARAFKLETGKDYPEGSDLPDAYTLDQIQTFKTFADNIYGSYNQSSRAKYENTAIGRNFAVFSTWMNGIVDVYAKKRLISANLFEWVQETDSNGELLFFDRDGNIRNETEMKKLGQSLNTPVMTDVPIMVQGIWYTLKDAITEIEYGGWDSFKSDIWENEVLRANLKRLLSDLLVGGILSLLFNLAVTPAYQEHKRKDKGTAVLQNALIELLYKGSSSSFDGFKGTYAILSYLGNQTNPATYKLQSKILHDTYSFLFGDKTLSSFIIGALALPRSFKDTYNMWLRDHLN